MSFKLPNKSTSEGPNVIREVFERGAGITGFISFGIGNPASEAIPVEIIQHIFNEVVNSNPIELLQYGPMNGDQHLREQTVEHLLTKRNMPKEGQEILLSTGSGQCLGLVPRTICSDGDEVYMDAYTFTSGINAVHNAGAVPVGIEMDDDGMIPAALEAAAKSGKGRYIYLIPNFQNPTGLTMPLERRKAIYEVACKYDLFIYEDDPYGEIRFTDEAVPTFKSMDKENRVLYVGSYSKTVAAGLRVGFLYGPAHLIEAIQGVKNNSDGQMPLVTQRVVSRMLDTIDYDEQLKNVSRIYKEKCQLMLDTFDKFGTAEVKLTRPSGGMFIWMTMPDRVDSNAFFEACMEKKVGIIKSSAFATPGTPEGKSFRLNYTFPTKEDIAAGMEIVGKLAKKFCER